MKLEPRSALPAAVEELAGLYCLSVISGVIGSMFTLLLGPSLEGVDSVGLRSRGATPVEKGQFELFVQEAPWRLSEGDRIVATHEYSSGSDGAIARCMQWLEGKQVEMASTRLPYFDLELKFGSSLRLEVFCLETDGDNYCLFDGAHAYGVAAGGRVVLGRTGPG